MTADAETRRIYGEGCLASHQGKLRSDCPYPEGSVDRAAWTTGWDEASEDDLREGGTCEECFESASLFQRFCSDFCERKYDRGIMGETDDDEE
jgi:ribosome modulation factor